MWSGSHSCQAKLRAHRATHASFSSDLFAALPATLFSPRVAPKDLPHDSRRSGVEDAPPTDSGAHGAGLPGSVRYASLAAGQVRAMAAAGKHVADVRTLIRYWESERWPNGTLPCGSTKGPADNATAHAHSRPDLIIYTAQPLSRSSVRQIRRELRHAPRSRQCFHRLRFVSADLTDAQNVYNRTESGDIISAYNGPLIMFTELAGHPALRTRYRYALYMEPDAVPIRGNFLGAVADT
eukprot:ctg_132.g72